MSPTSYRTALPRVIRPKRFAPTAKIIIARFAAPVNPCGEISRYITKGAAASAHCTGRAGRSPSHITKSRHRARKTVQTKNQPRGRSPGPAHITKSRHRARRAPKKPAPAKPSRQKISLAVVPPAPPTSQSRGTAPAERRKSPRPQNRPDKKSVSRSFPRPAHITKSRHRARRAPKGPQNRSDAKPASRSFPRPRSARKRRGHPAAAAPLSRGIRR